MYKVLHFVSGLVSGGVEQVLYNYIGNMDNEKFEHVIVYQHEPIKSCKDKLELLGVKTIRITARSESFKNNIDDSIKVIKQEKPDIVHSHMNYMNFCALYAAKKCNIPVRICHSHTSIKYDNAFKEFFRKLLVKVNLKFATDYFACGKDAGDIYFNGKEYYLMRNAIDLDKYSHNASRRNNFRKSLGINENTLVVGNIGRFTKQKNHKRLIEIWKEVVKKNEDSMLLLVGDGEELEETRTLVDSLNLSKNVQFLGTLGEDKILDFYSGIDLFILPSLYEGLPVVCMEIQAEAIRSLISDNVDRSCNVTGTLNFKSLSDSDLDWANTIMELFRSEKPDNLNNKIKMTEYGFNIKNEAEKLENKYIELVNQHL